MALKLLKLESLDDLDGGKVAKQWEHQLKHVIQDCISRPGDDGDRVVTLEFRARPAPDPNTGACEGCYGEFQIKSKVPTRRSKTYNFGVKQTGGLFFNEDSPGNVDQSTFDDIDPATGKVDRTPPAEES